MKDCTYYDLLGIPMDASSEEITDAKNFLVKKLHPDANVNSGYDTTPYIRNVLDAYRILSDDRSRRIYDRRIRNPIRRETASDKAFEKENQMPLSPNFAPYWEASSRLNELVAEGSSLLKQKRFLKQQVTPLEKLNELACLAEPQIQVLESGAIPRQYWYSYAMNWLLFQWSQNRDLSYSMLFTMYDSYLEQCKSGLEKRKLLAQASAFLANLDKLIACRQLS